MIAERHLKARTQFHFTLNLGDVWWKGVEALAAYIESRPDLSEEPLSEGLLNKKEIPIRNREQYLIDAMRSKFEEFVLSNGRRSRYRRDGVPIEEGAAWIRGGRSDTEIDVIDVTVEFRAMSFTEIVDLFEQCGDLLAATTGHFSPSEAFATFAAYGLICKHTSGAIFASRQREAEPLVNTLQELNIELPGIILTSYGGRRTSPLQPEIAGWLNYWSGATCEYLGFPALWPDANELRLSHRTPRGAYVVRLTQEPLDIRIPDHVRVIASAYKHLPNLGVRV
jgi:hypothetical protein